MFLRKIFSHIWVPKTANFAKNIFEFISIAKFRIYTNREITLIPKPEDYSFRVEILSLVLIWYIFSNGLFYLISRKIFLRIYPN